MKALRPGDPGQVGKYRLLGHLGSGGMGRVFLGRSPGGRLVAVKLIRADVAQDPDFRARFEREVTAARNVSGLFTAPVVDADPDGPQPWLVTAYVPGPSLADAVASQGPLPVSTVLTLAAGLAEGLGAIHAAGLVHRDLKPSNVLLASDGPRIIDFGIARAVGAAALTRTDLVVGSPGFMSPEQAKGQEAGPPSDIFCLGAVIAYAATGEGPFGTGSSTTLLFRIAHTSPDLSRLPARIRCLAERMLDKDPARRPTTDAVLAQLGTAQPAADWLPRSITQAFTNPAAATVGPPARPTARDGPTAPAVPAMLPAPVPAGAMPAGPMPAGPGLAGAGLAGAGPAGPAGPARGGDGPAGAATRPTRSPRPHRAPRPAPPWAGWLHPRRQRLLAIGAAGLAALLAAAVIAATASSAPGLVTGRRATVPPVPRGSSPATPATPVTPGPQAVVISYFAAINARNWPRVWGLGGKNLGEPYATMVAGYQRTGRDAITGLQVAGNVAIVHLLAYGVDHTVQRFVLRYVVQGGVITSGRALVVGHKVPVPTPKG